MHGKKYLLLTSSKHIIVEPPFKVENKQIEFKVTEQITVLLRKSVRLKLTVYHIQIASFFRI